MDDKRWFVVGDTHGAKKIFEVTTVTQVRCLGIEVPANNTEGLRTIVLHKPFPTFFKDEETYRDHVDLCGEQIIDIITPINRHDFVEVTFNYGSWVECPKCGVHAGSEEHLLALMEEVCEG